ncbi:hypothetical protein BJ165DRAFT_1122651 [Panaeolus papilionaceus]|nr:hypothetical protein BJ165DRAFT_1122651 [Panaeolus papilionaceus]
MGKSKAKGFKLKQYKVPSTKWVVLVNAWGFDGQYTQERFNQICVWFEFLLRVEYPKFARVKTVYYQKTHHRFIIELPKEIEGIGRYLGAYHDQSFLKQGSAQKPNMQVVLLYEYKYASFGSPASTNWSEAYPTYATKDIPPGIPLKSLFDPPLPAPAPPIDCPYAQPNPPRVAGIIYGPPKPEALPSVFDPNPVVEGGVSVAKFKSHPEVTHSSSAVPRENLAGPSRTHARDEERSPEPSGFHLPQDSTTRIERPPSEDAMDDATSAYTPYRPTAHYTQELRSRVATEKGNEGVATPPRVIPKVDPYEAVMLNNSFKGLLSKTMTRTTFLKG